LYTGCIYAFYPSTDPAALAASITRLAALPKLSRTLPGHNSPAPTPQALREAAETLAKLGREDKLRHGSGLHELAEDILVRF
jgi:hypothetical protein